MTTQSFDEAKNKHLETLKLYVPIVARVHGANHPEFLKVRDLYDKLVQKINGNSHPDLSPEFVELREITDNYAIPEDVCESYTAVYNMLSDLDKAYQA